MLKNDWIAFWYVSHISKGYLSKLPAVDAYQRPEMPFAVENEEVAVNRLIYSKALWSPVEMNNQRKCPFIFWPNACF